VSRLATRTRKANQCFGLITFYMAGAPSSWGYLKPTSKSAAFSPDPSPKARSQFLLHLILPPSTIIPRSGASSSEPARPIVPERLEQVVRVHWDWKATPEESIATQFWRTMDELDILFLADESIREYKLHLCVRRSDVGQPRRARLT
jgi:hypothetical protein